MKSNHMDEKLEQQMERMARHVELQEECHRQVFTLEEEYEQHRIELESGPRVDLGHVPPGVDVGTAVLPNAEEQPLPDMDDDLRDL